MSIPGWLAWLKDRETRFDAIRYVAMSRVEAAEAHAQKRWSPGDSTFLDVVIEAPDGKRWLVEVEVQAVPEFCALREQEYSS